MSDNETTNDKNSSTPPLLLPAPVTMSAPQQPHMPPPPPPETSVKDLPLAAKPRRSAWPYWLAAGFIILAGGEGYLFVQQQAHQADKTDLAVLQVEVSDLRANAAKTSPLADLLTAQAQLAQKQATLTAQLNAVQGQVTTDHATLTALQMNAQEIGQLTARMALLNTLATARMALNAGQPLGTIPHAAPALAIFANTAPPTLLQLKEAFPDAARHAEAMSLAEANQSNLWARVKLQLEGLITITDGSHVVFGPPAAAALNRMRVALSNDDLASALDAAKTLSPATQAAMASWLIPAQQLQAARQALLTMARQGT